MVHLDFRDSRPIYSQIVDRFREQILAGVLRPGERMPSVRELAAELAINPNTIQRSYRELESGGWIISVAGKGSFVQGPGDTETERLALLAELDKVAEALLRLGLSRQELAQRIEKGGNDHA